MTGAPTLAELQTWFRGALTQASELPRPNCWAWIQNTPPIDVTTRMGIYSNAYFVRLMDALIADFERTHWILGAEAFEGVTARYLERHPSTSFTITDLGARFAAFLSEDIQGQEIPYLADLARLEWAKVRALYSKPTLPLDPVRPAALANTDPNTLRLELCPSLQFTQSAWAISAITDPVTDPIDGRSAGPDSPDEAPELAATNEWFITYRTPTHEIRSESVGHAEWQVLREIAGGATLGEVLDRCEHPLAIEFDPHWFARWTQAGIIADVAVGIG